ncbi:hypothetical protein MXB_1448 [Myxobolus squamalis]|nr:hypothetical protein MXB_1448 [Myxobolus squamalis]
MKSLFFPEPKKISKLSPGVHLFPSQPPSKHTTSVHYGNPVATVTKNNNCTNLLDIFQSASVNSPNEFDILNFNGNGASNTDQSMQGIDQTLFSSLFLNRLILYLKQIPFQPINFDIS